VKTVKEISARKMCSVQGKICRNDLLITKKEIRKNVKAEKVEKNVRCRLEGDKATGRSHTAVYLTSMAIDKHF